MREVGRQEILAWRQDGGVLVVDLLPEPYYARRHLPGALNACVYQVSFVDDMLRLCPDRQTRMVVYADGPDNRAWRDACSKLAAAGFGNVHAYSGGLENWLAAGLPVEGHGRELPGATAWTALQDATLAVDPGASSIRWFGSNGNVTHHGTLAAASGSLGFLGGVLRMARVELDMDSLANLNLEDTALNRMLVAHLKSEDFFETARYPKATLTLAEILESTTGVDCQCCRLRFHLTLKATTLPLDATAILEMRDDGRLSVTCAGTLDRTLWGVLYGSSRFYRCLGMHLVHDDVRFEARLVAA